MAHTVKKSAQIAAYFLAKAPHRHLDRLKLIKLMYFADRAAMDVHGYPISDDLPHAMPHGMVLTNSLDLIRGVSKSPDWDAWVRPSFHFWSKLARPITCPDDLDELSQADLVVMRQVWEKWGGYTGKQLEKVSHDLPEWTDPNGSSYRVPASKVFIALGKSANEASALQEDLDQRRKLAEKMAEYC